MIKVKTEIQSDLIPIQYIESICPGCHFNIKLSTPESFIDWESAYEELQRFEVKLQARLTEAHQEVWKLRRAIKLLEEKCQKSS